jgi:HAMP domain-containing protein
VFFRLCILILLAIGTWIRSRIYRQLMVSHLAVIMITFIGLIAIGVMGAIGIVLSTWPGARTQAIVAADALPRTEYTTSLDRNQAQGVLDALRSGRARLGATDSSPLLLIVPWSYFNYRVQVLDSHGTVIAAVRSDNVNGPCAKIPAATPLPAALRRRLMQGALRTESVTATVPASLACNDIPAADQAFAAAAVYATGAHTHPLGVVIVQGRQTAFAITRGNRIFGFAIVSFGAVTALVIAITVLPTLAISSLAALIFARGMTRRLVDVSRAAGAIADGDLSRRAPVNAHNEIGRLAQDFNRMAALSRSCNRRARRQRRRCAHARNWWPAFPMSCARRLPWCRRTWTRYRCGTAPHRSLPSKRSTSPGRRLMRYDMSWNAWPVW